MFFSQGSYKEGKEKQEYKKAASYVFISNNVGILYK